MPALALRAWHFHISQPIPNRSVQHRNLTGHWASGRRGQGQAGLGPSTQPSPLNRPFSPFPRPSRHPSRSRQDQGAVQWRGSAGHHVSPTSQKPPHLINTRDLFIAKSGIPSFPTSLFHHMIVYLLRVLLLARLFRSERQSTQSTQFCYRKLVGALPSGQSAF